MLLRAYRNILGNSSPPDTVEEVPEKDFQGDIYADRDQLYCSDEQFKVDCSVNRGDWGAALGRLTQFFDFMDSVNQEEISVPRENETEPFDINGNPVMKLQFLNYRKEDDDDQLVLTYHAQGLNDVRFSYEKIRLPLPGSSRIGSICYSIGTKVSSKGRPEHVVQSYLDMEFVKQLNGCSSYRWNAGVYDSFSDDVRAFSPASPHHASRQLYNLVGLAQRLKHLSAILQK